MRLPVAPALQPNGFRVRAPVLTATANRNKSSADGSRGRHSGIRAFDELHLTLMMEPRVPLNRTILDECLEIVFAHTERAGRGSGRPAASGSIRD